MVDSSPQLAWGLPMTQWEPVIGLEVHVQLDTASKAFSTSGTQFGQPANALADPTVLGLPGALPVFNARALTLAVRLGLASGCKIRRRSRFARKHYFYPDLPKGYQISQFDEPVCEGGAIEFVLDEKVRRVPLTRIHLEEDAGKNIHRGAHSLVDLNRAGIPLCEVVSEPEIHSAHEAAEYMRALHQLVRYLDISEGNMEQGHLRCDANVSIRPMGQAELGTRTELKNINSFRFVQNAIENEISRQVGILERGGHIERETRLWDADTGRSKTMRTKEEADDYRYFPDPDLPTLVVSQELLETEKQALPELPVARWQRLISAYQLPCEDARALTAERKLADYFDSAVAATTAPSKSAKPIANWIQTELIRELHREQKSIDQCPITPIDLAALTTLIADNVISGKIAKNVFRTMYQTGDSPQAIVKREGLRQITDSSAIAAIAEQIVSAHPKQAADYRNGKTALLGFFVGRVMRETQGKANPGIVNQILKELLEE